MASKMVKKRAKLTRVTEQVQDVPTKPVRVDEPVAWMKARYRFHTFAYRDPRSAFSSAVGLPVVSPTTVLLGIASTLFSLGEAGKARSFLERIHLCEVVVDPPEGIIFFRAFHQIRRYETDKYRKKKGPNPRMGLTDINQGTREYGLVGGEMTIYVGAPADLIGSVELALRNRDHLGTHDSLCSLVEVRACEKPTDTVYLPPEEWQNRLPAVSGVTILTLSRFRPTQQIQPTVGEHWWMAGGADTQLAPYLVKGTFRGTSKGKIYRRN